ncbi:MAG: DUF4276 family protein [Candidatus Altarchaeum sp.]|nr:DUF4276 family protein [Candidatus Altarchaeum sp.]
MNKIGIIVEGESDKEILKVIIDKLSKEKDNFRFSVAGGKKKLFEKLEQLHINELVRQRHCNKIIVFCDYDNSETIAERLRNKIEEIKERKKDILSIELCFSTQEIESWLLGCYEDLLKEATNEEPDNVKDPVTLLENFERKKKGYKNFRYNKISDGKRIAEDNKLQHFKHSASFKRFEEILQNI